MQLRKKKLKKNYATMLLAATVVTSGTIAPLVSKAAEYVAPPGAQMWEGQMVDENGNVQHVHPERPLDKNNLQKPMTVQDVKTLENGVKLNLGEMDAYIRLLSSDISKVSILKKGEKEYTSVGIAKTDWDTPKFKMNEDTEKIVLSSDSLTVQIKKSPFGIKYLDKDGNVINEDAEQGVGYENGKPYVFKKTGKNEDFYGFGQKTTGLNHRGKEIGVWNRENLGQPISKYTFSSVPFFIGLKGTNSYGILFDNTYRSYYNMAAESDDYYYFHADGGKLTYYFINGPEIKDVVDRYTDLTGKMQMPPKWAMGFHQAAWGYHQKDLEQVSKTYREKKIPADGMWYDIEWMDDYKTFFFGNKFPDPDGLNEMLEKQNYHTVAIVDPAMRVPDPGQPEYLPYTEGTNKDLWVENPDGTPYLGKVWPWGVPSLSVFPNFLKQETRDWWAGWHKTMFDRGIDGIWNDMNEPANFSTKDYWSLPLDTVFETDNGGKLTHEEAHNIYAHLENQATDQAFKTLKPNERPFVLTRASFTGTQRYATATWTGDNWSEWEMLRISIFQNANVGLTGFAMVGNDIGGFAKKPHEGVVATSELFARWIEVGAFYPFSRDHYNNDGKSPMETEAGNLLKWQRQEPWQFGKEVEDISRKYISLRYELMPYLYNTFKETTKNGKLIQQPLVYQFQEDEKTHNIQDQFMFGDSLMMAPVVHEGKTSRDLYLPSGANWVDYWTGEEFKGGQTIHRQADLATLPIYVKKDSIIPRREVQQHTGEKPLTNLTLDTYLDEKASYSFYEDDAKTEDYKRGEYNLTTFEVKRNPNKITFKQKQEVSNYKESKLEKYTLKLNNTEKPDKIQAGNSKYKEVDSLAETEGKTNTFFYDANKKVLYISIPADEKKEVQIR
ncbi:glycoside hydrolase family 31 protein [Metabacillus bambusae]|uniref:Glycoside hydrolase family 31 protein n=1 Tax=Metabacillus bambusae TaxID=2795218 RepID=A0ABS3N589_9BACI|nr:glycoside hydrolase family 31 protein [Metabacillus bambusae]MBO1513417.1 glycoside hydrolase family 31 protein [Metabacillus bambusae]